MHAKPDLTTRYFWFFAAAGLAASASIVRADIAITDSQYTLSAQTQFVNSRNQDTFPSPVYVQSNLPGPGGTIPAQTTGPFFDSNGDSATATAGPITYAYTANSITGMASSTAGASNSGGLDAEGEGANDLEFLFTVNQSETFTTTASFTGIAPVYRLEGSGGVTVFNDTGATAAETGSLSPGITYDLFVQETAVADVRRNGTPTTDAGMTVFSFVTTPTPEPASISLLGLGALSLLARRRRV